MQTHHYTIEEINAKLEDSRYTVTRLLGVGAMAGVYLAEEKLGDHVYAFKILHEKYRETEKYRDIFRNEAKTMQRFQHPNIVRFFRYIEETHFVYIQMDYVKGVSLYEILKAAKKSQKPLPLDQTIRILRQTGQGLNHLHHENQLHLDVKPGNILLQTNDGKVFVTDLGLTMDGSTVRTYLGGTPYYMPYEQQLGTTDVSTTADSYALAIVAYEMLSLKRPFEVDAKTENGREKLKQAHQSQAVPNIRNFREDLPLDVMAVFEKALAKNPDDRYQVSEFITALHQALIPALSPELQSLQNVRPTPLKAKAITPAPQEKKGNKLPIVFAIGLILVGIIATGLFLSQQGDNDSSATGIALASVITEEATDELSASATDNIANTDSPSTEQATGELSASATDSPSTASNTPEPLATENVITNIPAPTTQEATSEIIEPTATASPTDTATVTATSTATATLTASATATLTTTATLTPTASTTPTPIPTTFLDNEPAFLLAENLDAIGIGSDLNDTLQIFQSENQPLIPLRSAVVNGFFVRIGVDEPSDFSEYGVVYRYQSETDYWLFRIISQTMRWEIVEVNDAIETIQESEQLATLPMTVLVAGRDEFFRYEFNDTVLQFESDSPDGSLALWMNTNNESASIATIEFGLLGDEAVLASENIPTLVAPNINLDNFIAQDLSALLETATMNGQVVCSDFIARFDSLERHIERDTSTNLVTDAISQSNFIYNRCQTVGTDQIVNLNDAYVDFLNWQNSIGAIIDTINAEE